MKKVLLTIATAAMLSACAGTGEKVIAHSPNISSVPSWTEEKGGEDGNMLFQIGYAESDSSALTSSVEKMAEREARRAFASAAQAEVENFVRDEIGLSDSKSEQVAQETTKLKASGIRVTKTYWQKVADGLGTVRIRAWAYATMSNADFRAAIDAAKNKSKKIISEDTSRRADAKWAE